MLIQMVETELEKRKSEGTYTRHFKGQSHFFGYVPASESYFNHKQLWISRVSINLAPRQFMLVIMLCFVSGIPGVQI